MKTLIFANHMKIWGKDEKQNEHKLNQWDLTKKKYGQDGDHEDFKELRNKCQNKS
jgi:hypothetical protein